LGDTERGGLMAATFVLKGHGSLNRRCGFSP
jgi:hypothetical protein